MSPAEEWKEYKLIQLKRLEGLTFELRRWETPLDSWDHDHCHGCWAKFGELDGPDILHVGYCTTVPAAGLPVSEFIAISAEHGLKCVREPISGGFAFRWVCRDCFDEFRSVLGFKERAPSSQF